MKRWLRHHRYALGTALRRLQMHPFSSLANVLVIALSLSMPILAGALLITAEPVVRQLSVSPEITLYLTPSAKPAISAQIQEKLHTQFKDEIAATRLVSRSQAHTKLQSNPNWAQALAALPYNPLPDAIVVTLKEHTQLALHADALAKQWRQ